MKRSNRGLADMISSGRSRIGGFWKNEEDQIRLVGTLTGAAERSSWSKVEIRQNHQLDGMLMLFSLSHFVDCGDYRYEVQQSGIGGYDQFWEKQDTGILEK